MLLLFSQFKRLKIKFIKIEKKESKIITPISKIISNPESVFEFEYLEIDLQEERIPDYLIT